MSQSFNQLTDEFAKLMTDIAGAGQGVKREAEGFMKSSLEKLLADMDLVNREEFEVLKDRIATLEEENSSMKQQLNEK